MVKQRHGNSRVVIIAVASVIVLLCFFGLNWLSGPTTAAHQGEPVATEFLKKIGDGQLDSAWEGTTAEFKSFMGRDRFRQFVRAHPVLAEQHKVVESQPVTKEGLSLWECVFRPESGDAKIEVVLAREGGEWKVERLHVE